MPEPTPCSMDQWTVIAWPHGSVPETCAAQCPVGYDEIVDDEGNWCFEPEPVPIEAKPVTPPPAAPSGQSQMPGSSASSFQPAVSQAKAPVPTWVFGLVAVVGVFALAAWMTPD